MYMSGMYKNGRTPRILVVDDDRLILKMIHDLLIERDYTVDLSGSAVEALELFGKWRYDLVLTDIMMPEMDGIDLLKELRRMINDQVVIMITAQTVVDNAVDAIRSGAYDYVLKPVKPNHMLQCIDRGLEKARLQLFEKEHLRILETRVVEQSEKIRLIFSEAIESLVNAIEARDSYTQGHSLRVTENVDQLVRILELPSVLAQEINLAAKLHDIGKLGMSDAILNKTSGLDEEEYQVIKEHPDVGYKILKPMLNEPPLEAVRHHHETWDGTGYPAGLSGTGIPLGARIIAIADTYDAMTSNRAYRPAINKEKAIAEIEDCAGTSLDPDLVEPFISIVKNAG